MLLCVARWKKNRQLSFTVAASQPVRWVTTGGVGSTSRKAMSSCMAHLISHKYNLMPMLAWISKRNSCKTETFSLSSTTLVHMLWVRRTFTCLRFISSSFWPRLRLLHWICQTCQASQFLIVTYTNKFTTNCSGWWFQLRLPVTTTCPFISIATSVQGLISHMDITEHFHCLAYNIA